MGSLNDLARHRFHSEGSLSCPHETVMGASMHLVAPRLTWLILFSLLQPVLLKCQAEERIESGLVVLYDFSAGSGSVVHDRSGAENPLDLRISEPNHVDWHSGSLLLKAGTRLTTTGPARRLSEAVRQTGAVTIEAWVRPANTVQTGPARIISLSENPSRRNVTLGQDSDAYDIRFRTSRTDRNGNPSLPSPSGSLTQQLTHVVYSRDASGVAVIYLNGTESARRIIKGGVDSWSSAYPLVLGNEVTGDRPWLGELHLVAIYARALDSQEIRRNYEAGSDARALTVQQRMVRQQAAMRRDLFEQQLAPLLASQCMECHDRSRPSGGLNLAERVTAEQGGESGLAIVKGKAEQSLLWKRVRTDEMPHDRVPLNSEQKDILKRWLDDGAVWTMEEIDPADYVHREKAGEIWVQRLTIPEYIETVRSAVGVEIGVEARKLLPADIRADGFRNTAYNLSVDLKHVEAYARLAEVIVGRMDIPRFAARFSKSRQFNDDRMRDFVAAMGRHLLRGPLGENEITVFSGIATTVSSAGGEYDEAVSLVVEAMLQSPRFLYRIENHHGTGTPRSVGAHELACRLSYMIWGGPPDDGLMQAAASSQLLDRAFATDQIERMLRDPRARKQSLRFAEDWLNLDRLTNLRPESSRFPGWSPELAADIREETLRFFDDIVWEKNRGLSSLIDAGHTFATPRLAKHYGWPSRGDGWQLYDLSDRPERGGLLTQASLLTIGGDDASMVSRGLLVFHELLRGTVNAPPPCVNTNPPATAAGMTQRIIAESRIADQRCGVCHARFEPLAFGLERFDGVGRFSRRDVHGNRLREDGEILVPGTAHPRRYRTSAELMKLLAGSPRVRQSLTWKVAQFLLGRPLTASDASVLKRIHATVEESGGTWSSTVREIVLSELVFHTRTERIRNRESGAVSIPRQQP